MKIDPQYISFKDPDAIVLKTEIGFTRYLFYQYKDQYEHLMQSGLYDELVKEGLLIPHQEIKINSAEPKVYKQILPEQIPFQSYPFEWSYLQWRKAALAFLKINKIALKYGMILKDASPYNFYLKNGKAILFDTSSFVLFTDHQPWLAYRQFCELFFAPIALMKYNGADWAKIYMANIRGFNMQFVSKQLPLKSWMNLSCLIHIHLHAKYEGKKSKTTNSNKGFTKKQLNQLFDLFIDAIRLWKSVSPISKNWETYYEEGIESELYLANKKNIITEWMRETKSNSILDLGANTGVFSIIATSYSKQVIAAESDSACVDIIEKEIKKSNIQNLTTLVTDLSETSPALGMLNKEYQSFIQRAKSDLVLALALVHHLCISKNLALNHVAELFSSLSNHFLIVEFIPKSDPKTQLLLNHREDVFLDYQEENFQEAMNLFFILEKREKVADSDRILYLFKKK